MLEEALEILAELPNLASSINTFGQLALAYLHLGEDRKALEYADKVLALAANISPTVYSLDVGFSAVSRVYFSLWEKALRSPAAGIDPDRNASSAEKGLKLLRAFRKVFPIGQAFAHYYQGWYEELSGTPQQALKSWRAGLEAAQRFKLLYEEGLIRVRLGSHLRDDPDVCRVHFERAIQIFEKMKAVHQLASARAAQQRLRDTLPAE
jgi:tetratricopeptide (TPR) repeat protein